MPVTKDCSSVCPINSMMSFAQFKFVLDSLTPLSKEDGAIVSSRVANYQLEVLLLDPIC